MRLTKVLLAAVSSAALVACGGGGGGGTPPAPQNISVVGTAAKGLLSGADVTAFSVTNGQVSTTPLATVQTDANGAYTLAFAPTTSPVVILVSANATTLMLDETQTENGDFLQVPAPLGLTLRSVVLPVSGTNAYPVSVNPFTEAAVAVAADGGFTPNAIVAGQKIARLMVPEGVNPFTTRAALLSDATDEQKQLLSALAGFAQNALEGTCGGAALNAEVINCALNEVRKVATDLMAEDPTQAIAALNTYRTDVATASVTATKDTSLANVANDLQFTDTTNLSTFQVTDEQLKIELSANTLEGFVINLRDNLLDVEKRLKDRQNALDKKYENIVFNGVKQVGDALEDITNYCEFNEQQVLVCDNAVWFEKLAAGKYKSLRLAEEGTTMDATITGSFSASNGYSVVFKAKSADASDASKTLADSDITITAKGLTDGKLALNGEVGSVSLKGFYRAYHYPASNSSTPAFNVKLSFDDLKATAKAYTQSGTKFEDITLDGQIEIESSLGEILRGKLETAFTEKVVPNSGNWPIKWDKLNFELYAEPESNNPDFLRIRLTSRGVEAGFGQNQFDTFRNELRVSLTGDVGLRYVESKENDTAMNFLLGLRSGNSSFSLRLLADQIMPTDDNTLFCIEQDDRYFCGKEVTAETEAGTFKAVLVKSDGKFNGDILDATGLKVGVISQNGVQVNGRTISFN